MGGHRLRDLAAELDLVRDRQAVQAEFDETHEGLLSLGYDFRAGSSLPIWSQGKGTPTARDPAAEHGSVGRPNWPKLTQQSSLRSPVQR